MFPSRAQVRLVTSEARSFEQLVREHEPALRAFALRLCGSEADASDLVQDCLERAYRRFDSFVHGSNSLSWFFAILHNAFIDRCRHRRVARQVEPIEDLDVAAPEPIDPPRWADITPEQVLAAVARLSGEFRIVYEMHAESMSYKEISDRLGIPLNTVGTRISRARARLRALLEESLPPEVKS